MMNPSSWCNPPPPGIDMDEESKGSNVSSPKSYSGVLMDQIDPYIKNPEYIRYKRGAPNRRSRSRSFNRDRSRSKSRSRSRERRRKHRSRSRSRTRHRRSRSRSRTRRHRRHSHSTSRSRSRSVSQARNRHKHKRSKKSRRSRSRSRSHDRRRAERKYYADPPRRESVQNDDTANDSKGEEEEADTKENAFKNDGSFLEMFKKMQEEKQKEEAAKNEAVAATPTATTSEARKLLPAFGKRRGGRVLKTGMVEKTKAVEDDELANATDPWSIYLKEVKRYKEACCDDDSKTRPLVK
ncbi:uncharacterized protein DDB_G0287625-like isoform X1 [Atheta coriaria]|uniref:uncharacterized protein DDB_G0287625-like isoform X1 n=1 Tax=Dalotia coriaria TaxID=877792 RepID=UPI0031F3FD83